MDTKTCNTCHQTKPIADFYVNRRWADGRDNKCKACHRTEKMSRYWEDPEAARKRNREAARKYRTTKASYFKWYADRLPGGKTEYYRRLNLKRNYGLEHEDFVALLEAQGGVCAICKQRPEEDNIGRSWSVDHDHATGKVRGILCRKCNWALGHFGDSIEVLKSAIAYLERQRCPT